MSRVDEAMRRAAEEARACPSAAAAVSSPIEDRTPTRSAVEPFPAEMPEPSGSVVGRRGDARRS